MMNPHQFLDEVDVIYQTPKKLHAYFIFSRINHPRPKGRGIRRDVGVDFIVASCGEYYP
jgi:hypothetical protein